jgi:two-component sensor histidine kinase
MAFEPDLAGPAELDGSAAAPVEPADLYISPELHRRVSKITDHLGEKLALQDIAAQMVDHPEQVLPKLVERTMAMTGALSAGISAFEAQEGTAGIFRWRNLKGELARFEGTTTPRNYSPCGVCLDRFETTLTRRPERYYSWIADADVSCPEVLLVPLYIAHGEPLGTLWIVSEHEGYFDSGHARIMRELASFTGIALAMLRDQQRLKDAVRQREILAAEMSHRVKNLFSIVSAMIHVSKRSAASAADMANILSGRLQALAAAHALVRPSFGIGTGEPLQSTASMKTVIRAILKPYEVEGATRLTLEGPEISLGSRATTGLALVIHEFATDAAKYGAFVGDEGRVTVSWRREGEALALRWGESGGPPIAAEPSQQGFGSTLMRDTILRQFEGTFAMNWRKEGLVADFQLPLAKLAH